MLSLAGAAMELTAYGAALPLIHYRLLLVLIADSIEEVL
jgi:hypothetical protein